MRQLHASDSHGVERRREVVVRPDGSKVIRVEKRRRTYQDDQQSSRQTAQKNKRFLISLCILILLVVGGLMGTYMYRLTAFNTEEFAKQLQSDLSEAWGGNVEISGLAMDGLSLKTSSIKVSFPEDTCLSFVSLEGVSGDISAMSLFMGKIKGESLNVTKATVGLRPGFAKFTVPQAKRELPFNFRRYTAPRLEVGYAHAVEEFALERNNAPFYMTAEAYIRVSGNNAEYEYVLDLSQQKLKFKGWPLMSVDSGSVILNGNGIKQLTFSGALDKGSLLNNTTDISPFMITGSFNFGTTFQHRSWTLTGRNMNLASLVGDSFSSFLKVESGESEVKERHEWKLDFSIPVLAEQKRPSVVGTGGSVIKATMMRLPVLNLLAQLTAGNKEMRLPYSSPVFTSGSFFLESNGMEDSVSLKKLSLSEQGFLSVSGDLLCNGTSLSGSLVFKIPAYMMNSRKLPSIITQEGHEYVLPVKISGTPFSPQDNSGSMLQEMKSGDNGVEKRNSPTGITVDRFM